MSMTSATKASHVPSPDAKADAKRSRKPGASRRRSPSRPSARAELDDPATVESEREKARPKSSFSSGVPTVTRIALGAPNGASGRTITPSRSSASKSCATSTSPSTST